MKTCIVKDKLIQCIDILHDCNVYVILFICDQGPNNRSSYKLLNLSTDSHFEYNNSKIYFFYDPPYLIEVFVMFYTTKDLATLHSNISKTYTTLT